MKIYILNTEPLLCEEVFSAFYEKCPQRRKAKIDSKKTKQDKVLSLGCEILTERGFSESGRSDFEILYSSRGKPFDKDGNIHFSLSHSGNFAAAAFSENKIGIDIESRRDVPEKLADRFFSPEEIRAAQDSASIIKLWTRKEAISKAFDIPLSEILSQNVIADRGLLSRKEYFLQTLQTADFTLSTCVLRKDNNIEIIYHTI